MTKVTSSANASVPSGKDLKAEFVVWRGGASESLSYFGGARGPAKGDLGGNSWSGGEARCALHFRRRHSQRDVWAGNLQGLAHCGLLGKFHYLSTVSGGGYGGGYDYRCLANRLD